MKKFVAYALSILLLVPVGMQAISVREYIQEHGIPALDHEGRIDLSQSDITSLEGLEDIPNPEQVRYLELFDNQLQTLPATIFDKFSNITALNLSGNQLKTLPDHIFDKLTKLTRLDLSNNKLWKLSAGIFDFQTELGVLDVSQNSLRTLPDGLLNKTQKLRHVDVNENQLRTLPQDVFANLARLHVLIIGDNCLPGTKQQFKTSYLTNLGPLDSFEFKSKEQRKAESTSQQLLEYLESPIVTESQDHMDYITHLLQQIQEPQATRMAHACDEQGNTVLHRAVMLAHVPLIREIVRLWPSLPKVKNNAGRTPLHSAAALANNQQARICVEELLAAARHPEQLLVLKDATGDTPIQVAMQVGHFDILHILLKAMAPVQVAQQQ